MSMELFIIAAVFSLVLIVVVGLGSVWLYYQGTRRANPLTALLPTPKPKPEEPTRPPEPKQKCHVCGKQAGWDLSRDESDWYCRTDGCPCRLPGPKPKIRS
jgi:hypothetical protein